MLLAAMYGSATYAQTPTPFAATTQYLYIGAAGASSSVMPTTLGEVNPATGVCPGATFNTLTGVSVKLNGAGLNPVDRYLYAMAPPTAVSAPVKFYRVGENAAAVEIGLLAPPVEAGATFSMVNTAAGVMDGDNFYFTAFVYKGNPFIFPFSVSNFNVYIGKAAAISTQIDGATGNIPVTYHQLDISDAGVSTAFQTFLNQMNYANPLASDGGFQDIAINPVDGKFYTYISVPNQPFLQTGRPVSIDPANWKAAVTGTTLNTVPGVELAGAMFDPTGNFYLLFTNGEYYQADLSTGAISLIGSANTPLLGGTLRGDLASSLPSLALPVKLVYFNGQAGTTSNRLQWKSGEESHFKAYTIEQSSAGEQFTAMGTLAAKGAGQSYSFTDETPAHMTYYRLKMTDEDGTYRYSAVVPLRRSSADGQTMVYPTVVHQTLFIRSNSPSGITITNLNGQTVLRQTLTDSGLHPLQLDQLPHAAYLVTITDAATGQVLTTQQIVKQ